MTKDEILSMALEFGWKSYSGPVNVVYSFNEKDIERFAALVAEKERQECAKVCEDDAWRCKKIAVETQNKKANAAALEAYLCAEAIRARGQKEYRGARLVLTKDGVKQDGWMGDK